MVLWALEFDDYTFYTHIPILTVVESAGALKIAAMGLAQRYSSAPPLSIGDVFVLFKLTHAGRTLTWYIEESNAILRETVQAGKLAAQKQARRDWVDSARAQILARERVDVSPGLLDASQLLRKQLDKVAPVHEYNLYRVLWFQWYALILSFRVDSRLTDYL